MLQENRRSPGAAHDAGRDCGDGLPSQQANDSIQVTPLRKWLMMVAIAEQYGNSATTVVALRLLNHFNAETERCDPSYATLAAGAGVSRVTAMRSAQQLEADGWLVITHRKSTVKNREKANTSNSFAFNWDRAGDMGATTHGDTDVTRVVTPEQHGGDSSVTRGGHMGETQNLESETLNLKP